MFVFQQFTCDHLTVHLTLPEVEQAEELFRHIDHDRLELGRWMPWVADTKKVKDEINFLKYAQQQLIDQKLFLLIIEVNQHPVGMIDLHNLDWENHHAQVGYWLAQQYQGHGIITNSLKIIVNYGFTKLHFHKIEVCTETDNIKSRNIPQHLGFHHEGTLIDDVYQDGHYHNLEVYYQLNNKDLNKEY